MLYKSGQNLWEGAIDFVNQSNEITLFSAYIRTEQLRLLNSAKKIKQIIVRWEIKDLHQGASDLDLYYYCRDHNIALYRNTRIHLKCLINDEKEVFLGSANITSRGIGENHQNFNYELNSICQNFNFSDSLYFEKIISKSEYVTHDLFLEINEKLSLLEDYKKHEDFYKKFELETKKKQTDFFLISQLPMFKNIKEFYELSKKRENLSLHDLSCLCHDLATFDLDINLTYHEFYSDLNSKFNSHPLVIALKDEVRKNSRQSLSYGSVVRWITENTTTVPTPLSWELKEKQLVNNLYEWICFFDSSFIVERPNYSEILRIK